MQGFELMVINKIEKNGCFSASKLFYSKYPSLQPYLDYTLLSLINYAPEEINIHKSIRRKSIKTISLEADHPDFDYFDEKYGHNLPMQVEDCGEFTAEKLPQFEFEKLEELSLINYTELKNLDFLSKCKNLKKISLNYCNNINNLDVLKNFNKQITLDIENCKNLKI